VVGAEPEYRQPAKALITSIEEAEIDIGEE